MAHAAPSPHDAVSRLNERHRSQLLAIARSFGGIPDATDATAVSVDDDGIELDIWTTNGRSSRHIPFTAAARPDTRSRRLAFRQLARQAARQNNAEDVDVDSTSSPGVPGSYSPDQRRHSPDATHGQQHRVGDRRSPLADGGNRDQPKPHSRATVMVATDGRSASRWTMYQLRQALVLLCAALPASTGGTALENNMATIPDIPDSLLDIHHHWHSPTSHPDAGPGRVHAAGTPGGGLEFLQFHRNFVGMFHSWYDTHTFPQPPFNDAAQKVALVAPWTDVPAALRADAEWPAWDDDVARLASGSPDFATADELGTFIELGVHNNFLHGAAASAFGDPVVGTFHSPQSTYFYGIHGLVDHWWNTWNWRHKHHIKEIVKEVVAEVSLKELRDVVVKSLDTEVHKRIDDVKTFGLEVFEDPATLLVDPPAVSMVRERLVRVERQVFKNAITFIPPADRPTVGHVNGEHGEAPVHS